MENQSHVYANDVQIQMFLQNMRMFRTNLNAMNHITQYCRNNSIDLSIKTVEEIKKAVIDSYNTYNNYMVKASGRMLDSIKLLE